MKPKKVNKAYLTDASRIVGTATGLVQPETIEGVCSAVRLNKKICIRGGGSGLAGGAVPQEDVVLDLSRLDKMGELDKDRLNITVQAGVVLDDLQDYLEQFNLEFPVNPSSHSICTIGGMVACDAVGSRAVKYGKTSNWVNWISVVNSKGKIEKKSRTELSDYAGKEGISGVIVEVNLKVEKRIVRSADLFETDNLEDLMKKVGQSKTNPEVSMCEFLDKTSSELIGLNGKYVLIIEYESLAGSYVGKEYEALMRKRNSLYPILAKEGYLVIEDPKVVVSKADKLIEWFSENEVPVFGHISVGILHPCFKNGKEDLIYEMMKIVKRLGGQITGEHGVGLLKKDFVEVNDKKLLKSLKKRTDPEGRFNSGKII
jgi:FAD/FMN-containing dehydrogenase